MTIRAAIAVLTAAVAVLTAAALAACGITAEDRPRGIDPPRGPFSALSSPSPAATSGTIPLTLFLVQDGKLVAVTRQVNAVPTLDGLVAALVGGPTAGEADRGITSALLGGPMVTGTRATGGQAVVELAAATDGAPRTDEVLAYAQLVCTLTARPGISGVTFTRGGEPVGVPRADGSLSAGPLTRADYAQLLG